ncbi:MAG TPA: hypothetical protein VE053_02680 [Allosphingosinicella sp.]|nr:hypothetical protein [Allosphingosinicella sp.]
MRKLCLTLAALGAGLAVAGTASAQAAPAVWVNRILVEWQAIQAREGWAPVGQARPGVLAAGAETALEFPLAAGTAYRFVVVCEPGCGAGDVALLDPAGSKVGDTKPLVEMPRLEATPAAAGTYRLRVAMTDCATATCAWSAQLYSKVQGKPKRRR